MAYNATTGRSAFEIPLEDFQAANDRLSAQYHEVQDPALQREIVRILYDLDKPLFKAWRVFGVENRQDYDQEGFLWLGRALATFVPGKGSFIAWLRYYILKAQEEVSEAGRKAGATQGESHLESISAESEQPPDAIFWSRVQRQCTDAEWILVSARFMQGLPIREAAEMAGMTPRQAKTTYQQLLCKIRFLHIPVKNKQQISPEKAGEPVWVEKKWIRKKLSLTPRGLNDLMSPNRDAATCPFQINPKDILPIMGGRIRYFETGEGLIYPQIIRRRNARPDATSPLDA